MTLLTRWRYWRAERYVRSNCFILRICDDGKERPERATGIIGEAMLYANTHEARRMFKLPDSWDPFIVDHCVVCKGLIPEDVPENCLLGGEDAVYLGLASDANREYPIHDECDPWQSTIESN